MRSWKRVRWGLLALLVSGCGYGDGGGRIIGPEVVGGSLPPSRMAYALTAPSDVAQARVDDDALPAAVDLRRDGVVPPLQNQEFNACVGWTLGYYLMTGLEARHYRKRGYVLDIRDEANWFSPDYLYSQRETTEDELRAFCHLDTTPICFERDGRVGCMRPEAALDALMRHGCAPWSCLCGDDASWRTCDSDDALTAPGQSVVSWALAKPCGYFFRPRCFVRFGPLHDRAIRGGTVRKMQAWLHTEGTPIAAVVRMRQNWITYRGENRVTLPVTFRGRPGTLTEERSVCLDAGGRELGSQHMMTIIGYDRDFPDPAQVPGARPEHRGSFLVANQWGKKWGDDGLMWIPAVELEKIWVGGYGLIKWQWKEPVPGDGIVCAQNEDGRWIQLSDDGDDVPMNLSAPDPCGDPEDEDVVRPVPALEFAEGSASSGDQHVGGRDARGVIDSADWYRVEVPSGMTSIDAVLEGDSPIGGQPLRRVLDVRITDHELRDLTERDPESLEARAVVCDPGRYFIKVQPNPRDLYNAIAGQDPSVSYRLRVTLTPGQTDCGGPTTTASGDDEPLRVHPFATQTLPPPEASERRFHWFDAGAVATAEGWGRGTRMRVDIHGVSPPSAEIEVTIGGVQSPRHRPIDVLRVGAQGASIIIEDESIIVSPPGVPRLLASARNLTPGVAVSYDLTVSVLPAPGSAPPARKAVEPATQVTSDLADLTSDTITWAWLEPGLGDAPDAVRVMQEEWGYWDPTRGWRDHVLELRHACAAPQIELLARDGLPLPEGVRLIDAGRSGHSMSVPGVLYLRLEVPSDFRRELLAVIRDETGEPLREYSLRTLLQPSLATWPFVEGADNRADGAWDDNNGPTRPTPLAIDASHPDRLGYFDGVNGASWDLFDYYVVANPGPARTVFVSLEKSAGNNVDLLWWNDGEEERLPLARQRKHDAVAITLGAGEQRLLLVQQEDQGPTEYEITVASEDPRPGFGCPWHGTYVFVWNRTEGARIESVRARPTGSSEPASVVGGPIEPDAVWVQVFEFGTYDIEVHVEGRAEPIVFPDLTMCQEVLFLDVE